MTELKGFDSTPLWIKNKSKLSPNLREIDNVIERLITLGVLAKSKSGKLKKEVKHIYTKTEMMKEAAIQYYEKMGLIAVEQIKKQSIDQREFNSVSFNIKTKDIEAIKEKIRTFSNDIIQEYEANSDQGEETYHLNIQFFSLTGK